MGAVDRSSKKTANWLFRITTSLSLVCKNSAFMQCESYISLFLLILTRFKIQIGPEDFPWACCKPCGRYRLLVYAFRLQIISKNVLYTHYAHLASFLWLFFGRRVFMYRDDLDQRKIEEQFKASGFIYFVFLRKTWLILTFVWH